MVLEHVLAEPVRAKEIPQRLGLPDEAIRRRRRRPLGGWKMRVAMLRIVLGEPGVLVKGARVEHRGLLCLVVEPEARHDRTKTHGRSDQLPSRTFLRGLASRVLEIGGEDGTGKPVTYGGTYEEYVARSGHEAPGVHA